MIRIDRVIVLACIAAWLAVSGCGPARPPVAPVSGMVTLRGKPLGIGTISFYPQSGRAGMARIGSDGRYTLTTFVTGDGAVLGSHRVVIEAYERVAPSHPPAKPADAPSELIARELEAQAAEAEATIRWIVPEKYSTFDTSPLSAEVNPSNNTIDFAIP